MKILIIVPTLNSYHLLPKLVESLDEQTFKEWRVIFVDGNSSRNIKVGLDYYAHPKVNIAGLNKKSNGIFGAMNEGLELALNNEWVFFWGSDDWMPNSNTLENLYKSINLFPLEENKYDYVICKGTYYDLISKKPGRISSIEESGNQIISGKKFRDKLMNGFSPPHQGFIFSPSKKNNRPFYNDEFKIAADLDMFLRISKNDKIKFLILNLNLVCMSDQGISGKAFIRKFLKYLKLINMLSKNFFAGIL